MRCHNDPGVQSSSRSPLCHHLGPGVPAATLRLSPTKLSCLAPAPSSRSSAARATTRVTRRRARGAAELVRCFLSRDGEWWAGRGGARGFSHENILMLANFSRFSHRAMQLSVML